MLWDVRWPAAFISIACKLQRATGNIRVTQEFLGHSQITTTEIYAHIAEKEIEEAVNIAFQ